MPIDCLRGGPTTKSRDVPVIRMQYPLMFRLGQKLHGTRIDDVPAAVEAELAKLRFR